MKVSLKWLQRHVDLPESTEEIEKKLTSLGLEVEGREEPGKIYSAIIVAKVLECAKHPESDHLSITKVFDGKQELQVICGAPNVAAGQTVCFAPIGAELPLQNGETLKIKKAKIRGVESFGMICAEDEIGLGKSHDGILVLPNHYEAGTPIVQLGMYDVTLEVNVTPNRPDALSHIGIARELAGAFCRPLKPILTKFEVSSAQASQQMQLTVADHCGCSRYVGRVIENVQVAPSPVWLQSHLRAVGITPINNVVDITNFVLFDLGQPLHSFDMDLLKNRHIQVRKARTGETITTIDHKEHQLQVSDLLICDGDVPACVAGVMGGVESEITANTKRVFLESAWFDPTTVRKQSKRLGLSTDSSYRFERHIDPSMQAFASDYACSLIAEIAGGSILSGSLEFTATDHPAQTRKVGVRLSRAARVLGIQLSGNDVRRLLGQIALVEDTACCGVPKSDADELVFRIPGFRPDLEREIDLIEELARLVGFDQIPYDAPSFRVEINELPPLEQLNRKVRHTLSALGMHECLSLRFSSKTLVDNVFGAADASDRRKDPAPLLNPLSEDLGVLPVSLIPGLLKNVAENEKNRPGSVRLFECAKAFFAAPERRNDRDPGFDEVPLLSGALAGHFNRQALQDKASLVAFADLKGVILTLCKRLRIPVEFRIPAKPECWLHPYRQAELVSGKTVIGVCGEAHPRVLKNFDINIPVYLFELDLIKMDSSIDRALKFNMFSRQVNTTRDVSIEVDERMPHDEVMSRIKGIQAKNLIGVQLKSIYQGEKIAAGRKNLLYQFTYQAEERTLTDEEVNKVHDKLRERLAQDGTILLR